MLISLDRPAREKHYSLLEPIVRYEENEVFWKRSQEPYWQHLILSIAYKLAK